MRELTHECELKDVLVLRMVSVASQKCYESHSFLCTGEEMRDSSHKVSTSVRNAPHGSKGLWDLLKTLEVVL